MVQFDKFIRSSMIVRDVKQQHPHTSSIFEEFGFPPICDDCSIDVVAKRQGVPAYEVIDALNLALVPGRSGRE